MSYIRYDYSLYGKGAKHGLIYENQGSSVRAINTWRANLGENFYYFEYEVYDPTLFRWIEHSANMRGYFELNDNGLDIDKTTISSFTVTNQWGTISTTLDTHLSYRSIWEDISIAYNSNSSINGSNYNDILYGDNGDDVIRGGGGNDTIIGGNGQDRVVYGGHKSRYSIGLSSSYQLTIRDNFSAEGVDQITGIEIVEFGGLSYDIEALRSEALFNSPAQISNRVSRLLNQSSGKHLFSANQTEIDYLTGGGYGWVNEGTSYLTPSAPTAEVYRFLVSDENRHFYTANQYERDLIRSTLSNFVYEGVAYNVYSIEDHLPGSTAVVRYYNGTINSHVYSTSAYEQYLLNQNPDWLYEGIAWYGEAAI